MEEMALVTPTISCLFLILLIYLKYVSHRRSYRLPPSPALPLPILGHLHLLREPLHRTFHRFSQTHGPIFSLKLGSRRVVVVSSPDLVSECFSTNDVVLSNRPRVLVDKYIGYGHTTVAGEPYGRQWRSLRRLAAQEVLSPARLGATARIRHDETRRMLKTLAHCQGSPKFELRPKLFELIFNIIMRMLTGRRFSTEEPDGDQLGERFREMVSEVFEHAQASNPEDFLPFLLWIDYRGLKKKMAALAAELDNFYQGLLEEHRREKRNTIIGHLLSLQDTDPEFYTDQIIKGFITNMIIAGTDTSVVTVEWAMSLLLKHPDVLDKATLELHSQVGHDRFLEEQDLPNLPYLNAVISETFRMFPPGPLLVPRESSTHCKIGQYDVPPGTTLLVNAWAIQRDPDVWDHPTHFRPERFDQQKKNETTLLLMPFGVGRRACPGAGLGQRLVGLALGSLIQCFEWSAAEEVDLAEGVGLTMPKLKPLEVVCRAREHMLHLISRAEGGIN